jgi:hypothetical protein
MPTRSAVRPASRPAGMPSEELLNEAIAAVYDKLKRVSHSTHIVALSQELRELIKLRKYLGYDKK